MKRMDLIWHVSAGSPNEPDAALNPDGLGRPGRNGFEATSLLGDLNLQPLVFFCPVALHLP